MEVMRYANAGTFLLRILRKTKISHNKPMPTAAATANTIESEIGIESLFAKKKPKYAPAAIIPA